MLEEEASGSDGFESCSGRAWLHLVGAAVKGDGLQRNGARAVPLTPNPADKLCKAGTLSPQNLNPCLNPKPQTLKPERTARPRCCAAASRPPRIPV